MAEQEPEYLALPVSWVGLEELSVFHANQFVGQVHEGEVFLTIGQLTPPPLVGSPEERRDQASQIAFVPIRPIARVAMTPHHLQELIGVLQTTLENVAKDRARRSSE